MATTISFIGRTDELAIIDDAIRDWGSHRVICIAGDGGIGKTRLLQEVANLYDAFQLNSEHKVPERKKIALLRETGTQEWSRQFISGVCDMANQLDIDISEYDAGFDTTKMAYDLRSAVVEAPDAIIINMGSCEQIFQELRPAFQAQIPVILVENYFSQQHGRVTARILQDNHQGALDSLEHLANNIAFRGKIAIVWSSAFEPMMLRKSIVENFVTRYPDIELIYQEISAATQDDIRANTDAATRILIEQHPDLCAIWSTWDALAHGVVDALLAVGHKDIAVYTFDLGSDDIAMIKNSANPPITAIASNAEEIGRMTIRIATLAAFGQKVDAQYLVPMHLANRDNMDQLIASPEWQDSEYGWTPWLRARQAAVQQQSYTPLKVVGIIDFDDRQFHDPSNIGGHIAEAVDRNYFEAYLQELHSYRELEEQWPAVSPGRLRRRHLLLTDLFTEAFNTLSRHQRIVLLFDTTDALTRAGDKLVALEQNIIQYLFATLARLQDTLVLIAGRDAVTIGRELTELLKGDVTVLTLQGLSPDASAFYLSEKQRASRTELEPELADKLLALANGRPILLDLAVEWRSRGIPLTWIEQLDTHENPHEEFEKNLVAHIGEGRQLIDWLILLLARIYSADEALVQQFFDIEAEEARNLVAEARTYVFIKTLPDMRISLHDEMRRMVNTYVWPKIDESGSLRQQHSSVIAAYLQNQIRHTEESIVSLEQQPASLVKHQEEEKLSRTLPVLAQQWVDHALVSDPAAGMVAFADQFDTGRNNRFRQTLLAIVERAFEENAGQFSPEAIYEYRSRKVKYLLDNGEYEAAATIVDEILAESEPLTASQQIDMLIQRANLEIRRGMLETGIATFDTAIQLSEKQHLTEWHARALNGRGWAFRNQGNYEQALNDYRAAYQLSLVSEDTHRVASISNNMGYVYGILGNRQAAFGYCEDALDMWQTLDHKRYIGSTYSTMGEIARWFGEYDKAQDYYDQAMQIFKAQEDNEWISIVTTGRGLVYLAQDQMESARTLLKEALPAAPANTIPRILHHLAAIEWRQGNVSAAQQQFEACRVRSQETGIYEYDFRSFADLLDIYWEQGAYAQWSLLRVELTEIMNRSKSYWVEGSALRKIADLAICNKDYAEALQLYQEGVLKIADHTVRNIQTIHRRYTLVDQFEITEARLRRTGLTDSLRQLGHDLSAFWIEHDSLMRDYARALRLLRQWQKG